MQTIFKSFTPPAFIWCLSITSTLIIILALLNLPVRAASYYSRDYSAVGDGRTNDQAAIQSAIETASTNGVVEVIPEATHTLM
jgi:hypothetical protein